VENLTAVLFENKTATLTNGLRVVNFSSPHEFIFEDGTVLSACSKERAEELSVKFDETVEANDNWYDIILDFEITYRCMKEINKIMVLHDAEVIDVVLIPLPMMNALKKDWSVDRIRKSPFRCVRMKSRTEKVLCIDRFCL